MVSTLPTALRVSLMPPLSAHRGGGDIGDDPEAVPGPRPARPDVPEGVRVQASMV
ncbi:hypothetical protein GCM10027174_21450 [Salinifilum aidingensis]